MSVFTEEKIYWIGPRESDIDAVKHLFAGSITIFGSNENGNRSFCNYKDFPMRIDHNNTSQESDRFLVDMAREYVENDRSAKFMLYNGNIYNSIDGFKELQEKYHCILCVNDSELMDCMNDKHNFHAWLEEKANILPVIDRSSVDYHYDTVSRLLDAPKNCRFIIQAPVASGGSGTFILDQYNGEEIEHRLNKDKKYLVSVYQENNVSVNIHAIIYSDEILFTPGSVQIMKEDDMRLMYRGADFIAYRSLDETRRAEFERQAMIACKLFQAKGYRGVCGIDAIITDKNVLLLEVNNRFQSSTNLLNFGLVERGHKSVHELNYDAFTQAKPDENDYKIHDLEINYSDYAYIYNGTNPHADAILARAKVNSNVKSIDMDGYHAGLPGYEKIAHLFRVNFNTNIVWINEDHIPNIHENIADPSYDWMMRIRKYQESKDNWLALKVALMTQGVVISDKADAYLAENGGIRPATNDAVDLKVAQKLVVNAPVKVKFVEFSPFTLDLRVDPSTGKTETVLLYYGEYLCNVGYFARDDRQEKLTSRGLQYSKVAYLSTDRLRVHLTNNCRFKKAGVGCTFCNMPRDEETITIEDVREVVEDYQNNRAVKHYLVGGQSEEECLVTDKLIDTIRTIRETDRNEHHRIYAMILPCDEKTVDAMRAAGLNELAFNIEIYDEELAKKYMPGKSRIPRSEYMAALKKAAGRQQLGETRSMLIVGLEPLSSTYRCITELAQNKIQPILSVFRPLPETPLADIVPPSMEKLCEVYKKASDICRQADQKLKLGPECIFCQNNTLSMPYNMED